MLVWIHYVRLALVMAVLAPVWQLWIQGNLRILAP